MNKKKIMLKTIAGALAATNLATISAQTVNAFENEVDTSTVDVSNNVDNSVDVTIEDTDVIDNNNNNSQATEDVGGNLEESVTEEVKENEDSNNTNNESNGEGDITEDDSLITDNETVDDSESVADESNKEDEKLSDSEEANDHENNTEISTEEKESAEIPATYELKGKLEIDVNFPMPIINANKITFSIFKDGEKIGDITDLSKERATLENGVPYKIEKLNSKRQPLEEGETNIYFLHITFDNLDLGDYSLDVKGAGYIDTKVENIEIINYSKRVTLGSGANSSIGYKGVFLAGDVNGDGIIDMGDYNLVFENMGKVDSSEKAKYDLNKDGIIDIADLTYINENIGAIKGEVDVTDTDAILKIENIEIDTKNVKLEEGKNIKDILTGNVSSITMSPVNEKGEVQEVSPENPLKLQFDLSKNTRSNDNVKMDQIVIKAPEVSANENAGVPSKGSITYTDENGAENTVNFDEDNADGGNSEEGQARVSYQNQGATTRVNEKGDVVIDLGSQVAVKQISINVTGNRGNKNISEIAKIEFLNNVYKEIPKPDMNIPVIKTVETSTNLHDERITISWEPQINVTSYEVKYEKLDDKGNVTSTKKLQTNKTNLNILDKAIKPYDLYRVSIQSLNGDWQSGYEAETGSEGAIGHPAFDGIADNVDADFNPIDSYYNNDKGPVSEIQVIPIQAPAPPRNLTTSQGYKSFTVNWESHSQARDFDIYFRKIGDSNKSWIKANENNIEVTENSTEVTNPDKSKLVRSHSYTVNGLEDKTSYEVRVTATNHHGTSKMSETYMASTISTEPPVMTEYKLINRPTTENEIGTTNITDVRNKLDKDGWSSGDSALTYDSEYALVDGDFTTSWRVKDWDTGAVYGSNRGSEITFDKEYEIGSLAFARNLEKGYGGYTNNVKVTYWDQEGNKKEVKAASVQSKQSNGHTYYIAKLSEPITAKNIKVDISGGNTPWQIISELRFYEYDSIADDIKNLYEDDLRLVIKETVNQKLINELRDRLNTQDPISKEDHPEKAVLLKELECAEKLFNDKEVSEKITKLDGTIKTDNVGPALGMNNDWQSLGSVARPGVDEKETSKQIVVYMGSSDSNTQLQIGFLQTYALPGAGAQGVVTIRPGRNEITIPSSITADVEKGGQVVARVTGGNQNANIQIRLSGVTDIPHLNVNNLINDSTKVDETKGKIRTYIGELRRYMANINNLYPDKVSETDKINNIYLYDEKTSPLNSTDIEGDRFTLTLPASEILKGIESGLVGNEDAQVERVYNALLAWEQEVLVGFAKKGVYETAPDFNKDENIDNEEQAYFNKHKAPLTRLNIKYQRMMLGAAAYASSHHIGVGFGSSNYIQGVPYKFDEKQNVVNEGEARLYGELIGHEMGHVMDIGDRIYPETSNNLMAAITGTMMDNDSPYVSAMPALYEKVTSNTLGLSTNRSVVLNMLWQPYLAYEDDSTYKMLFTDVDNDATNDSYFAKLNRAYREMTTGEKANGDRDQWLIRMTSKVIGKDLSEFYYAHGIAPNLDTLQYVSQFPKETRKIQYINDEARRMRMAKTADMAEGTKLSASFGEDSNGNKIIAGSYVNDKQVAINLSANQSNENILGYEILRNGQPAGFIEKSKTGEETIYVDVVDDINNRVVEYSAVAYDYNLNATEEVEIGIVKIRHEGGIAKSSTILTTNTISIHEESNDIHSCGGNEELKHALDNDYTTAYEGRMLTKEEFNSSVHLTEMNPNNNPYLILDTTEAKTLVGIKYTAPTKTSGWLFKKEEILDSSIKKYKIEVSKDGTNWTVAKEGTLNLTAENPTATIYFDKEGVTGGNQLNSYNARYVKVTALGTKNIAAAELELITPPGDNIEIGVSDNNINYENGLGILKEKFTYQIDNPDTDENEERSIPQGSIIITGEYRGNPAFNVPLVLNQNDEHIADKYSGILLAQVPDNGNLEEIAEGNWIYWVEPQEATTFMKDNTKIFAELYRTDAADASEGGQRMVSDTFKIDVPDQLPEISLTGGNGRSVLISNDFKAIELDENIINKVTENR